MSGKMAFFSELPKEPSKKERSSGLLGSLKDFFRRDGKKPRKDVSKGGSNSDVDITDNYMNPNGRGKPTAATPSPFGGGLSPNAFFTKEGLVKSSDIFKPKPVQLYKPVAEEPKVPDFDIPIVSGPARKSVVGLFDNQPEPQNQNANKTGDEPGSPIEANDEKTGVRTDSEAYNNNATAKPENNEAQIKPENESENDTGDESDTKPDSKTENETNTKSESETENKTRKETNSKHENENESETKNETRNTTTNFLTETRTQTDDVTALDKTENESNNGSQNETKIGTHDNGAENEAQARKDKAEMESFEIRLEDATPESAHPPARSRSSSSGSSSMLLPLVTIGMYDNGEPAASKHKKPSPQVSDISVKSEDPHSKLDKEKHKEELNRVTGRRGSLPQTSNIPDNMSVASQRSEGRTKRRRSGPKLVAGQYGKIQEEHLLHPPMPFPPPFPPYAYYVPDLNYMPPPPHMAPPTSGGYPHPHMFPPQPFPHDPSSSSYPPMYPMYGVPPPVMYHPQMEKGVGSHRPPSPSHSAALQHLKPKKAGKKVQRSRTMDPSQQRPKNIKVKKKNPETVDMEFNEKEPKGFDNFALY